MLPLLFLSFALFSQSREALDREVQKRTEQPLNEIYQADEQSRAGDSNPAITVCRRYLSDPAFDPELHKTPWVLNMLEVQAIGELIAVYTAKSRKVRRRYEADIMKALRRRDDRVVPAAVDRAFVPASRRRRCRARPRSVRIRPG